VGNARGAPLHTGKQNRERKDNKRLSAEPTLPVVIRISDIEASPEDKNTCPLRAIPVKKIASRANPVETSNSGRKPG